MSVARSKYGAAPLRNEALIEEASQAYSRGDPLQPDSTATNEVEIYDDSAGKIVGIATKAATGVTSAPAFIHEVHEGTILEANAVNESSATAIAQTHINHKFGLKESTNGSWIVDLADAVGSSSSVRAIITGLAGMAQIGDTNPRVEFVIIPENLWFEVED
jgi:hypothetical protein